MESLDGVAELHMSGARAVLRPAPGQRLTEARIVAALEKQGLALTSFEKTAAPAPAEVYLVDSGIT